MLGFLERDPRTVFHFAPFSHLQEELSWRANSSVFIAHTMHIWMNEQSACSCSLSSREQGERGNRESRSKIIRGTKGRSACCLLHKLKSLVGKIELCSDTNFWHLGFVERAARSTLEKSQSRRGISRIFREMKNFVPR